MLLNPDRETPNVTIVVATQEERSKKIKVEREMNRIMYDKEKEE